MNQENILMTALTLLWYLLEHIAFHHFAINACKRYVFGGLRRPTYCFNFWTHRIGVVPTDKLPREGTVYRTKTNRGEWSESVFTSPSLIVLCKWRLWNAASSRWFMSVSRAEIAPALCDTWQYTILTEASVIQWLHSGICQPAARRWHSKWPKWL